jgi:hypothetical protein
MFTLINLYGLPLFGFGAFWEVSEVDKPEYFPCE